PHVAGRSRLDPRLAHHRDARPATPAHRRRGRRVAGVRDPDVALRAVALGPTDRAARPRRHLSDPGGHSMIKRFLVISLLLALAMTACSEDTGGGADAGSVAKDVTPLESSITEDGCAPAEITTAAGPTTFHVTNEDAGAVTEFEVLD